MTAGSKMLLFNIATRLDRSRFEPTLAVLNKGGALESRFEEEGIPVIEMPTSIPPRPLWNLVQRTRKAAQAFKEYPFDLWHSFHYSSDYTEPLIARWTGAKAWIYTKKNMAWINRANRAWLLRSFLASHIAADNTTMLDEFFDTWWARGKVTLIPHSVDGKRFHPGVEPILNLRAQLGIELEMPLIGSVAQVLPVKGHTTLIRALLEVPDAHLVIAGDLSDRAYVAEVKKLIFDLGLAERVHLLGYVSNIPALLVELDVFVLPTLHSGRMEGCPVALLEALACGTASIATDIPGSKDIIQNGTNGWLVPANDPHSMAKRIRQLIKDVELRTKFEQAGRQRIVEHYLAEREARDYEDLYTQILQGRVSKS